MQDFLNRGLIVLNEPEGQRRDCPESTIIITGVARGGTSMLAHVLSQLGVFLGDSIDPVVLEDTDILAALLQSDSRRLEKIIADRNQRFWQWGFKAPNLFQFLNVIDDRRFRNPLYIVIFRDPLAVARRNELTMCHKAIGAIRDAGQNTMALTSYVCQLSAPALLISYEKAIQNHECLIDAISAFCCLSPGADQKSGGIGSDTFESFRLHICHAVDVFGAD